MTAGLEWDEVTVPYMDPANACDRMEASADWVQFVINRPMAHEPGSAFEYSSGVTQLLSHIFQKATGKDIAKYAEKFLFTPLGVMRHYWKRTPTGLPDTQGGLYLARQDLARIGYLYLKDGVWKSKRILATGWVQDTMTPRVETTGSDRKYGYQWWLTPHGVDFGRLAWTALGFGGQSLFVVPAHDLIVVFTGWNIAENKPPDPGLALGRVMRALPNHQR